MKQRDQFLHKNGLDIHPDIRCRWSTQQSTSTAIIKQCISGNYREQNLGPTSRLSARYPYVGCLAFVTISLRDNNICAVSGYLEHSEECKASRPRRDPLYRLLPVRKSVENLLSLNVGTADILAQNAQKVKTLYQNQTLIGNHRTLLTAMDIANIKKQVLHKNNIRRDAAENLERFLGKNADESELKEACIHYQPRNNEHNRLEIIICTPEQQKLAWKYGHSNIILFDEPSELGKEFNITGPQIVSCWNANSRISPILLKARIAMNLLGGYFA